MSDSTQGGAWNPDAWISTLPANERDYVRTLRREASRLKSKLRVVDGALQVQKERLADVFQERRDAEAQRDALLDMLKSGSTHAIDYGPGPDPWMIPDGDAVEAAIAMGVIQGARNGEPMKCEVAAQAKELERLEVERDATAQHLGKVQKDRYDLKIQRDALLEAASVLRESMRIRLDNDAWDYLAPKIHVLDAAIAAAREARDG